MTKNSVKPSIEKFGERLEYFLKIANISKSKLAEILDVTGTTITSYVQSRNQPSMETILVFDKLGCDINWLITGRGEMFSDTMKGRELRQLRLPQKPLDAQGLTEKYQGLSVESSDEQLAGFVRDFVVSLAELQIHRTHDDENDAAPKQLAAPQSASTPPPNKYAILQRKIGFVRKWLTVSGDFEEWWWMLKAVKEALTFDEVLAWEGEIPPPNGEYEIPFWFWGFVKSKGINPDWVLSNEAGAAPFLEETAEGTKLKQYLVFRHSSFPTQASPS